MKINYRIKRITNRILVTIIVMAMLLSETQLGNMPYVVYASEAPLEISEEATTSEEVTTEVSTEETVEATTEASTEATTETTEEATTEATTETTEETNSNITAISNQLNGSTSTAEDLVVSSDITLTSDMTVNNLEIQRNKTLDLNGYILTVEGKSTIHGNIVFDKGELICKGNINISSYANVTMDNLNDYMMVYGNLTYYGKSVLTAGVIEAKGNFTANNNFVATDSQKVILSGDNEQKISVSEGGKFNNVEIRNYSSAGITILYSFNYAQLIDNDCVINYQDVGGERGYTLTEDTQIDGTYYLVSDTLNLNGYTMTINGDLIQAGGAINVNGGQLIVNGNYRVQSRTVDAENNATYGQSTGTLTMTNEADYMYIGGDFISETSASHRDMLTAGTMEITGDMNIVPNYYKNSFVPSGKHTIVLSGEDKQDITFGTTIVSTSDSNSHICNMTVKNTSEEGVSISSALYVSGAIDVQDCKIDGILTISYTTSFLQDEYIGDIYIFGTNNILNKDICITGDVTYQGNAKLAYNLTVNGSISGQGTKPNLVVNGKKIIINGSSDGLNYTMNNSNDYLYVGGNLNMPSGINSSTLSNGTIELEGNLTITGSYTLGSAHRIILSGDGLQTVDSAAKIGILELQNYSEEGVYSDTPIPKDTLIRNGCKLKYGSVEGEFGWALTDDYVYEGDLILIDDELNLNGHTLTVNGDLIQISGVINVNSGKLIVNGDYRMQGVEGDIADGNYIDSTGAIQMTSTGCILVYGDLYYYSNSAINEGTLELKGDLYSKRLYMGNNTKVTFSGDRKQVIGEAVSNNITFATLYFKNTSEEGIEILGKVYVTKHIDDNDTAVNGTIRTNNQITFGDEVFQGSLYVYYEKFVMPNLHIKGNLTNEYYLYVYEDTSLKVDGDLVINDWYTYLYGNVTIGGNCNLNQYGQLILSDGVLDINGNLNLNYKPTKYGGLYSTDGTCIVQGDITSANTNGQVSLSSGLLEVKGDIDLKCKATAKEAHTLILSGDKLQTIALTSDSTWGTIELQNYSEEGVFSERIFSKNKLVRNGCRLRYGDCQGEFGWTLTGDQTWEGDLVIIDDVLDLNGHTLTVTGNLIQQSGDIKINGGKLIVNGDYRMQTVATADDGTVTYGNGASRLVMDSEEDYVLVQGDYIAYSKSSQNGCATAGTFELKGNMLIDNTTQAEAFYFHKGATLVLSGDTKQSITTTNTKQKLHMGGIKLNNTSGEQIATDGNLEIYGLIATTINTFDKPIYIMDGATFQDDTFNGDIYIYYYFNLDKNKTLTINGDIIYASSLRVNGKLNVNGDIIKLSSLYVDGETIINGDVTFSSGYISMSKSQAKLVINGNLNYQGKTTSGLNAGTISISGDLISTGEIVASGTNKVILTGDSKQTVKLSTKNSLNILELQNTSQEGVYSENYFFVSELIKNNSTLTIGVADYQCGYTLTQDTTISGDYYLGYGVLNLNGYKLNIEGDLIHANGQIIIGGGELNVSGDYIQKVKYLDNGQEKWTASKGSIVMNQSTDKVRIAGDLDLYPDNRNIYNKITNGSLYLEGNIHYSDNYFNNSYNTSYSFEALGNCNVYLEGDNQRISGDGCRFANLHIKTSESLVTDGSVIVTKALYSECENISGTSNVCISNFDILKSDSFGGNLALNGDDTLSENKTIKGTLVLNKSLDLNGYEINCNSLSCNATLDVNGGRINCLNDMTVGNYGILLMTDTNDYICVGGDVNFNSGQSHTDKLTAGTLEIKGDFTDNYKMFKASGTHKTVLGIKYKDSGKEYIQYITFNYADSIFNTLVLKKDISKYVFSRDVEDMAVEVVYEIEDIKPPYPVTSIKATTIDMTSVTIEYGHEDNSGTIGYVIYRDGERIGSTGILSYTDIDLEPNTSYTYEVYPVNNLYQQAEEASSLEVTTLADTEAPTVPADLSITGVTGSSIQISWSASTDNLEVVGYEIYRDGESIAIIAYPDIETTYKDSNIQDTDNHSYTVVAYDQAGNKSDHSVAVTGKIIMPVITKVEPAAYSQLNNDSQKLYVYYKNMGYGSQYSVEIMYKAKDTDTWTTLDTTDLKQSVYNAQTYFVAYDWDTSGLDKLEYDVRFAVKDKDGNSSCETLTYYVDNVAPALPTDIQITSLSGVLKLNWNASTAYDCDSYNIYRRVYNSGEEYKLIYTERNNLTESYTDIDVEEGVFYEYAITAVDTSGNESVKSKSVKALVRPDDEAPTIDGVTPEAGKINGQTQVTIVAKDNKELASVSISYRIEDSQEWINLKELATDGEAVTYTLDTTGLEDGVYYYKFVATDAVGNTSTEEYTRRYEIDNTGISKINITETTSGSTFVQLNWDDVPEEDFAYFQVEQYTNRGFTAIGKVTNVLGYTVEGLNPNTTYRFRVVGYDAMGNKGEYSDVQVVYTSSDTVAPAINAIYPVNTRYRSNIELSVVATDNYRIDYASFYYSYDGESYTKIADVKNYSTSQTTTLISNLDISNMPEGKLYVKYAVYDKAGNKNALTADGKDIIKEYIIDRTAPASPQNMMAVAKEGYIALTWDKPTDTDVSGYKIYRANVEDGIFVLVRDGLQNSTYNDADIEPGQAYIYRMVAMDSAGNISEYSNQCTASALKDKTAPYIAGVSLTNYSVVGEDAELTIIARDNSKLSSIELDIRDNTEGMWINLDKNNVNGTIDQTTMDLQLDHMPQGEYTYRIRAIDQAGNQSEYIELTYVLDTTPAIATVEAHTGDLCINLAISLPTDNDFSHVDIYRRKLGEEGETEIAFTKLYTGSVTEYKDEDIEPWRYYEYKLHSYDQVGNCYVSDIVSSYGTDNDTEAPQAIVPDSVRILEGMELQLDGGESTDNVRITDYAWEISDGTTYTGKRIIHSFDKTGVYNITLTVTDAAGNSSSATTQVQVIEKDGAGSINITVVDSAGTPVPYAYVYLNDTLNAEKSYKTDSAGKVTISAKRGDYLAAAYKTGYIPKDIEVTVSQYEDLEYTITIPKGDIVVGDFSVHKMTLEEMVEAGVDFSSPANMHQFTFEVELQFAESPIPVEIVYVGDALGGGRFEGSSGGFGVDDKPLNPEGGGEQSKTTVQIVQPKTESGEVVVEQPIIVTVRTVQTVSWLKDMYSVELGVLNTADTKYVIENSFATINLPSGLSLTETNSGQSATTYMGDIAGQERKATTWIVNGDTPGSYEISADFSGNLTPFNCPVNAHFTCSQTIGVSGYNGLKIKVMPESTAYTGEEYYIQFSVTNDTGRPLYNFTTSFGPYTVPGVVSETYVIQPGSDEKELYDSYRGSTQYLSEMSMLSQTPVLKGDERLSIATLDAGQTIYGTYSCPFPGGADPTEYYYELTDSMVTVLTGNELGVSVEVVPISGHISKQIIKGVVRESLYGDPVDVTTGAYLDEYEALSITGRDILSLDLYYSSLDSNTLGELGYGWSHNFESYIVEDMGMVHYYTSPSSCASFVNEDSLNGIKYGTFDGNTLTLSSDTGKDIITYRSITTGMDGYMLTKYSDGTFAMTTPAGYIYEYDTDGKLTKMTIEEGRSVSISHAPDQLIVTEDATGNRLKLDYKDERLLSVTDNTGRTTTFAYTGDYLTTITNPIGETVSYEYDDVGRLTKGKNTYGEAFVTNTYNEAGQVVKQLDDRGNEIGFTYTDTGKGNITECIAADGSITTVESDLCGNITKITTPQGAVTTHEYDRLGNKVKSVDAYGNTYSYSYDETGNLVSYDSNTSQSVAMLYDDNGNLISATTDDGNTSSFSYDDAGNMINSTSGEAAYSYTYDDMGRVISQTRVGKGTITYGYEGTESQVSSITDENGNTSYVDYDNRGNLTMLQDALGNTTRYEYDLMNRPIKSTYPNGAQVTYTYNQYGKIASVTDALGYVTTYSYDTGGRMTQTTYADGSMESYGYDESGNMTTITTADGRTLTYEYDGLGNVTKIIYPDGTTEECSYDMLGQVTSSTDVLGNKTSTTYDSTGQVIGVKLPTGQSITATYGDTDATNKQLIGVSDSLGKGVSYTYDSMGNITSVTDALGNKSTCEYNQWGELLTETDAKGNKTTYTYDSVGQCIAVTNPDGTTTNIVYDPCGRVTEVYMVSADGDKLSVSYTYDSMSNISSYTDEMGNTTSYEYDLSGNLIKVTDSEGVVTAQYTYDCMGKVLQEKDASGIVVTYSYNKSDLVEKASLTSPTGEEKVYSYSYDDMGRVLTVTDPSGNVSSQSYDKAGNITELIYPEGGGISYTYDNLSRLTEEKLSIGTSTKYSYNQEGLLDEIINGRNQSLKVNYDVLGRISSTSDELGTVSYTYDANGNILTVSETDKSGKTQTISRTYDCMDRVTSYTDYKGNTVKYSYDELGNLISLTYPGGEIVRYDYDSVGLLTTVTDEEGYVTSYTYDKVGRLHTTTKPDGSVETNTYDKFSRLTERTVVGKDGSLINKYTYTYDSWGNIISMGYESSFEGDASTTTFTSASMTYDSSNRMVTYNGEDIIYDDDGNMLYGPLDGEMVTFTYDCRNRLTSAGDTTYEYDAENIRTATETSEYREEYVTDTVSDLSRVLVITREYKTDKPSSNSSTDNKVETETYYYGNGLIYEKSNDVGILVYHYNHLGSTTAVTDQAGKLVYSYDYGTYGELTTTTEYSTIAPKVRFLYNGQLGVMTDDNTLYYMRQRYYNPQIKRFVNQDILTGSIGNSTSLNRYSYVEGNPVSYTDPFGLSPFSYISQPLHNILDWLGMIPVVGTGFDLLNATIYLMEGKPTYALFAAISSIGPADGVKFFIKNGKKSVIGLTITGLFCQTDAGAGLKEDLTGLGQDYITYNGYDQMSKGELALSLTMDLVFGAKSGYDDLNIKKKKVDVDVDVDDFVPDNATSRLDKIDGDDLVPDNPVKNELMVVAGNNTSERRIKAERKIQEAANGSRAEGVLIGKDGDVPVYKSQKQLADSITSAGASYVGPASKGSGQIYRMDTPNGSVEIRIMQETPGNTNPYHGNRTIIIMEGTAGKNGTGQYTYGNGKHITGDISKSKRKEIGHTHGQIP